MIIAKIRWMPAIVKWFTEESARVGDTLVQQIAIANRLLASNFLWSTFNVQ